MPCQTMSLSTAVASQRDLSVNQWPAPVLPGHYFGKQTWTTQDILAPLFTITVHSF